MKCANRDCTSETEGLSNYCARHQPQARWADRNRDINESIDRHVKGNTFHCCGCGDKMHLSLMHKTLEAVAREAYRLGKMDEDAAITQAVQFGYGIGRST